MLREREKLIRNLVCGNVGTDGGEHGNRLEVFRSADCAVLGSNHGNCCVKEIAATTGEAPILGLLDSHVPQFPSVRIRSASSHPSPRPRSEAREQPCKARAHTHSLSCSRHCPPPCLSRSFPLALQLRKLVRQFDLIPPPSASRILPRTRPLRATLSLSATHSIPSLSLHAAPFIPHSCSLPSSPIFVTHRVGVALRGFPGQSRGWRRWRASEQGVSGTPGVVRFGRDWNWSARGVLFLGVVLDRPSSDCIVRPKEFIV